jgi:MEMO1 family protein
MTEPRSHRVARPAAVAGLFYPAEAAALRSHILGFLNASGPDESGRAPKLLIVPHAGTLYSGAVAASAYSMLSRSRGRITRVALIGPAHRVAVRGLAAPSVDAFETPLGRIRLDQTALADLDGFASVARDDSAHAEEHSLEVQLPFLQLALDEFTLVPLVAGDARPAEVERILERVWGGDETLIVISSDLSHYLPHQRAQAIDRATAQQILALDARLDLDQACGAIAVNGALMAARAHGLVPRLLALCDSSDTTGDPGRVVGYGAFAFEAAQ